MPLRRLHHLDLAVANVEKSVAFYLALLGPLDEEAIGQLAGEPDAYPDAWPGPVCEPFRYEVVKRAVEVRQLQVHRDAGDGFVGRGPQGARGPRVLGFLGPSGRFGGLFGCYRSFDD